MPTETNLFVLIDAGANTDPTPQHLVQNAHHGLGLFPARPRLREPGVGLMSIGTEEEKGNDFTLEASTCSSPAD